MSEKSMRKLLFLIPTYSSYYRPIKNTFEGMNWNVRTIDYRRGDLPIRILRFMPYFGGQVKASRQIETMILKSVNSYNPDLILTVKGESLNGHLLKKIKDKNNKLVNWFPDPMNHWQLMKKIAPFYDIFFHFDPMIVEKMRVCGFKNVQYLPFAAEIGRKSNSKKIFDVSFVGTYSPYRENHLSSIRYLGLKIWGDEKWYKSSLKKNVMGSRVSNNKMKEIIEKSKVNINLITEGPREGANLRVFEVTGAGGFLISEFVKDLNRLFELGKEVVTFSSQKELAAKVKYYLENSEKRSLIAEMGYRKTKKCHNYDKRIKELLIFLRN